MSFSKEIKEELSKLNTLSNKEVVKWELLGYLISNNTNVIKGKMKYTTENEYNINRFGKLLDNLHIDDQFELQGKVYGITLKKIKIEEVTYEENQVQIKEFEVNPKRDEIFLKALVRGAFLGGGSFNNPHQQYHLEILFSSNQNARIILEVLKSFQIEAKLLTRKKSTALYMKDAEEISKLLAFIGAGKSVLNFEEIRVVRDTRNNVNRLVNCETANLNKTINAAVEQMKQIEYLKKQRKFEQLPDSLKKIANVRQAHPEASLAQLGKMLEPPIGKSGVNHRLKKICEMAEEIRNKK